MEWISMFADFENYLTTHGISLEGRKRSWVPIQGLQDVVSKDATPSVTVLLSHCRKPPTGQGEVLGGAAPPAWEEEGDLP